MEHAKHIIRALLLIIVVFVCAEVFRQSMIPTGYGEPGHYQAVAISQVQETSIHYVDSRTCASASCHEAEASEVLGDKHASIDCQICHAPLGDHANNDEKLADMTMDRNPALCLRCHERLEARPETLKQISFAEHMEELDMPVSRDEGLCLECHSAHSPEI